MAARPAGIFKNDDEARAAIGMHAYAATPKSVFALVAFHFAQRIADDFTPEGARKAIADEIGILHDNGLITPGQCTAAIQGLTRDISNGAK